jgi:hypothetical protein
MSRPPSLLTVAGAWLLFFPSVFGLVMLVFIDPVEDGLPPTTVVLIVGMVLLYAAILWKITARYIATKRKREFGVR